MCYQRNIDLLVSHFALKRNLVTRKCWPGNRNYMVNFHPGLPGSQLAGLKFFHVIAKLILSVFHRRAEIPANRASPAKRASPSHVIGPLVHLPVLIPGNRSSELNSRSIDINRKQLIN